MIWCCFWLREIGRDPCWTYLDPGGSLYLPSFCSEDVGRRTFGMLSGAAHCVMEDFLSVSWCLFKRLNILNHITSKVYPLVNSHKYWKLPFIVDVSIETSGSFHIYVTVSQRVIPDLITPYLTPHHFQKFRRNQGRKLHTQYIEVRQPCFDGKTKARAFGKSKGLRPIGVPWRMCGFSHDFFHRFLHKNDDSMWNTMENCPDSMIVIFDSMGTKFGFNLVN